MANVRVVVHEGEIQALALDPGLRDQVLQAGQQVAHGAAGPAPKRTGAGAASITAEAVLDGPEWTARVSWTQLRYYMYFHEVGTKYLPARPFLVPTLEDLAL